jgi:hypothetical protein
MKDQDWVQAFDEAYMNAVVHGTGFIRITTNGPSGLQLSVVDPKDYRYLMDSPAETKPDEMTRAIRALMDSAVMASKSKGIK